MKKTISALLATVLILALIPAAALSETTYTVYISASGGSLKLRSGPGTEYGINGYVMHGDTVQLISLGPTWSQVKVIRTGKTGYLKTMYFDGTTASKGGGSSATVSVKSGLSLRIRAGAGTGYDILGYVKTGDKVTVLAQSGDWVHIQASNGVKGWIMRQYLKGLPASAPSTSPSSNNSVYRVTGNSVNLRSGAGTGYSVRRVLPKGTAFRVTGSSGNWYQIKTMEGGYTGYISKNYSGIGATAITTGNLNMRSGAGTGNSILQTIPKGKSIQVTSVSGNWAYVTYNGKSGYCSINYLDF